MAHSKKHVWRHIVSILARRRCALAAGAALVSLCGATGVHAQAFTGLTFAPSGDGAAWAVDPTKVTADFPNYRFVPSPCVTYTTDASSGQYVRITAIFQPQRDPVACAVGLIGSIGNLRIQGNPQLEVPGGAVYRTKARLSTPTGTAVPGVRIGVGFALFDDTHYLNTSSPEGIFEQFSTAPMDIYAHHVGGTKVPLFGAAMRYMQPNLSVDGLAPNQPVTFNIHAWGLEKASLPGTGVLPLTSSQAGVAQDVAVGQPLKLSVNLLAANLPAGNYVSRIRLVARNATRTTFSLGTHAAPSSTAMQSGRIVDPWQLTMTPVPSGTYDVYYRLATGTQAPGMSLVPVGDGVAAKADGLGGYEYRIGAINVSPTATMQIGNTFHDYPLRGATPPVKQDYVRSMANYLTGFASHFGSDVLPNSWWRLNASGNVVMAWEEGNLNFDKWADTFAPAGAGRKLLITFYGSPLGVGEDDGAKGAWGGSATGFSISAPKAAMLSKYGEAVTRTVTRYKGRVAAVECWNEPDSIGHFVGSPTGLADFCAMVSVKAKAADSDVKVICPQASFPGGVGYIMSARTSSDEPIGKFCDMVGTHLYGFVGSDRSGRPYAGNQPLAEAVREVRWRLNQFPETAGKPLAVTEFGYHNCMWGGAYTPVYPLSSVQTDSVRAQIAYQSLLTLKEMGVKSAALYSYSTTGQESVNGCQVDGGFSWQYYYKGGTGGAPNTSVINQINTATSSF